MEFITSWAQGIIVSVIIATIIEMLLPNNGNGKYVKVVVGIFILFSIVSPIITKFKGKSRSLIDLDTYIKENDKDNTIQASNLNVNNNETIKTMYEENLKIDIKSKVSQKGYTVGNINLEILDNNEYTLNKIEIKIIARNEKNEENIKENRQATSTIVENIENIKIELGRK